MKYIVAVEVEVDRHGDIKDIEGLPIVYYPIHFLAKVDKKCFGKQNDPSQC